MSRNDEQVSWKSQAACLGQTTTFYAQRETKMTKTQIAKALRICNTCTVSPDCLRHAVEQQETLGVWGGMTWERRKHLTISDVRTEYACIDCAATAYVTKGARQQRRYCQRCRPVSVINKRTNTMSQGEQPDADAS